MNKKGRRGELRPKLIKLECFSLTQKMDMNQDGVVTLDEFISCCRNDEVITNSMIVFDNIVL